jgi:DNA-binding transcriptional regulator YiaG
MRKYDSEAMQVIYEEMESLYKDGMISAEQFHEFDDCLVPEPANAKPINAATSRAPVPQYASPTCSTIPGHRR